MTQICECPKCGTEHINLVREHLMPDKRAEVSIVETKVKPSPMSAEYQIQKAQAKGYDLTRCIHDVANPNITEFHQCPKNKGYGLGGLYCKIHSLQHPE